MIMLVLQDGARSVIAWLLTYAVHSTALLGVTGLLTWKVVRSDAWRDTLWKSALIGAVITTTVQQLSGVAPLGGQWRISSAPPMTTVVMPDAAAPVDMVTPIPVLPPHVVRKARH